MTVRVVVEADGGARGNPGPAGYGAVVRAVETGEVLAERGDSIGIATNNVAEYRGLIAGLGAAAELSAATVEVRMDSKLVVEQMTGRWRIRHPGLRPLAAEAAGLVRRFESVSWQWIPRERNRHADRLANEAMDRAARGQGAPAGKAPGPSGGPAASPRPRGSWEPPDAPPTRLLLVRHGETTLTAQRRYSGRDDVPLSVAGQAQAAALGHRIAHLSGGGAPVSGGVQASGAGAGGPGGAGSAGGLAAVVSSPLQRCTATAAAIAVDGPPVRTDPDLIECDLGAWEGRTFDEVRQGWPEQLAAWHTDPREPAPGGESLAQVGERVGRAVARLRTAYPAGTVVVVSHVWPLKLILRDALGAGDGFLQRMLLATAGLSVADFYPEGTVAVHSVNDTAHLAS